MEEMDGYINLLGSAHVKCDICLLRNKQELMIFKVAMVLMLTHLHFILPFDITDD